MEKNVIAEGFVYLSKIAPNIQQSPRYATDSNFLGRRVSGYLAEEIVTTIQVAEKLIEVQEDLAIKGLELLVYDGYRPQKAVEDFYQWSFDVMDQKTKELYYPNLDKQALFDIGFISRKSAHTRGSAVDLTIIPLGEKVKKANQSERVLADGSKIIFLDDATIDMGSSFDIFHEASYHDTHLLNPEYLANRAILRDVMVKYGFLPYSKEWWHYSIKDEPFPDSYFDFDII